MPVIEQGRGTQGTGGRAERPGHDGRAGWDPLDVVRGQAAQVDWATGTIGGPSV